MLRESCRVLSGEGLSQTYILRKLGALGLEEVGLEVRRLGRLAEIPEEDIGEGTQEVALVGEGCGGGNQLKQVGKWVHRMAWCCCLTNAWSQ